MAIQFADLENNLIDINNSNLPLLISGGDGSGASFFSVSLVVSLFQKGHRLLFFTEQHFATDQFLEQSKISSDNYLIINSPEDFKKFERQAVVLIKSGEKDLFESALNNLDDLDGRIIFVKNIEKTLTNKTFQKLKSYQNLILSGSLPESSLQDDIKRINFTTKIFFTVDHLEDQRKIDLPKRVGLMLYRGQEKYIKVKMD